MSSVATSPRRAAPAATGSYAVHAHNDIAGVDPREWDALLEPDDVQATHRFIGVCQRSGVADAAYRHITVHERGQLLAAATFCRMQVPLDLLSTGAVRGAIRAVRRWRRGFFRVPVAFCGLPVSFGQSCLRLRPGTDAPALTGLMARELESWAQSSGAAVACFKEFAPQEQPVVETLTQAGYFRAASLPSCSLAIAWDTFEEYLDAMRAGYRRQTLASLRARDRLGLTVRLVPAWEADVARIFPLYEQVVDRAPFQLERLNQGFFQRLAADLGGQTSALLVERDGALLAAAVLLHAPGALTFLLAGIDYAHHRQSQAYLTLVTEVVAEAIRRGSTRLELGQTTYELKQRLGAELSGRSLYIKCPNPVVGLTLRVASRSLFPPISPPPRRVFKDDGIR
ncbi:MAG TPA: GNAT family N-acetyltransferase [Candidatus Polarisedimenticolia bacterium]|nr:GNAT family N-acetyltransferase [Candidatus Polarisedimenticolia bacterium]